MVLNTKLVTLFTLRPFLRLLPSHSFLACTRKGSTEMYCYFQDSIHQKKESRPSNKCHAHNGHSQHHATIISGEKSVNHIPLASYFLLADREQCSVKCILLLIVIARCQSGLAACAANVQSSNCTPDRNGWNWTSQNWTGLATVFIKLPLNFTHDTPASYSPLAIKAP